MAPQYPPANPTAPPEPMYGEMVQTEALKEAAPLPGEQTAAEPETEVEGETQTMQPSGPPRNIISVLPPESSSPANTGIRPRSQMEITALAVKSLPGIDPSVRALADGILGRFGGPDYSTGPLPAKPPEGEETV